MIQPCQKRFYLQDRKSNTEIPLSPREIQCLIYLLRGKTMKQIGSVLHLSNRTVAFYLTRLRKKLCCYSRAGLIEKVLFSGWVYQVDPTPYQAELIQVHSRMNIITQAFEESVLEEN